jgi:hypothetical protein
MMGAVCAMVYLFVLIVFIPWPFYKDIVVATSGGGNRDVIKELEGIETGRLLHKFPHNKLASSCWESAMTFLTSDGGTKYSYPLLLPFPCLLYTLSTLA